MPPNDKPAASPASSAPATTAPAVSTKQVTVNNKNHDLFGRALNVIREDAIYIWVTVEKEVEGVVKAVEHRFNKADVSEVKAPAVAAPAATTPPPAE